MRRSPGTAPSRVGTLCKASEVGVILLCVGNTVKQAEKEAVAWGTETRTHTGPLGRCQECGLKSSGLNAKHHSSPLCGGLLCLGR